MFRITPTRVLTTLYSFTNGSDGAYPFTALIQGNDGNFYDTTGYGGSVGEGTVFPADFYDFKSSDYFYTSPSFPFSRTCTTSA